MHRDPSRDPDPDRADLPVGSRAARDPDPRPFHDSPCLETKASAHVDDGVLERAHIADDVDRFAEPDDRVPDELTRPMPGDPPPAVDVDDWGPVRRAFPWRGALSCRVDGGMLDEDEGVRADAVGHVGEDSALGLPRFPIVHQEGAESKVEDVHTLVKDMPGWSAEPIWLGQNVRMGKRSWIRPAVVTGIIMGWLVLAGVGNVFFAKLSEEQAHDPAAFLPGSAESTLAGVERDQFNPQDVIPVVVVLDGLTTATQYAEFGQFVEGSLDLPTLADGSRTVADLITGPPRVELSADGSAALAILNIPFEEALAPEGDSLVGVSVVDALREAWPDAGIDGDLYVTGVLGLYADSLEAFSGIDSVLLLVAMSVVFVILVVVYRSPFLPFLVLSVAGIALMGASLVVYQFVHHGVITLSAQSQAIMYILAVGATTDYALLLVARYREELRRHESTYDALSRALRRSLPPIVASGVTVILCLLTLLVSDLALNRALGPTAAIGIFFAMVASLTLLPAFLLIGGERARGIFWPKSPRFDPARVEHVDTLRVVEKLSGVWGRVSKAMAHHPRRTWASALVGLGILAAFFPSYNANGLGDDEAFLGELESMDGLAIMEEHFAAGQTNPIEIQTSADRLDEVLAAVLEVEGIAGAFPLSPATLSQGLIPDDTPIVIDGRVAIDAISEVSASSQEAKDLIQVLRPIVREVDPTALIGGTAATNLDVNLTTERDISVIIPLVLAVILLVLIVLLRSVVAPLIIVGANMLSFAATLGLAALMFNHVMGMPKSDAFVPLYGFVFLVALGVDYSIFLMSRAREETLLRGTREGVRRALAVTGGVITSAGIVLAATFGAIAILPVVFMIQMAFIVAAGILIDTFVVRTLLLPGLVYDIDRASWWPWNAKIKA